MARIVTFDSEFREEILSAFGKTKDSDGFIVDVAEPSSKVYTQDGIDLESDRFAGIRKGSHVFIRSDIRSLIGLADFLQERKP